MATKINYKNLPNVSKDKTVSTIKALADEFETTGIRVSGILNEAKLAPVGKIPQVDGSGAPVPGKPSLAFDTKASRAALKAVISKAA